MASIQSDPNTGTETEAAGIVIDGLRPDRTLTPSSPEEVAEALAVADREGHAVAPYGGGTKLALGNVPSRLDCALSTVRLDRVLSYEPTDLTLSVQAGMRFGDVQAMLAENGQTLPLDVADPDHATIGGLIATAMAGPRRLGSGTLRDLLIGISVAYPSGIVGKAGGMVVKNVTGFDLMRLHLGALGTLGVIVSANFKVLPAARHEATLVAEAESLSDALSVASLARQARLRPIAIEIMQGEAGWMTVARLEGRRETVAIGLDELKAKAVWQRSIEADESREWWRDYNARQSLASTGEMVLVRCGVAPEGSGELAAEVLDRLGAHDISPELFAISPGLGTVVVGFRPEGMASLGPLCDALSSISDSLTVLAAPPALKRDIDVWGRAPETISVMRALKSEFDPNGVLNRGRFVDRI